MRIRYKITIKTHQGNIITFKTEDYNIEGGLITFVDSISNRLKGFPVTNCEISEVRE